MEVGKLEQIGFNARLRRSIAGQASNLCVGLDIDLARIPAAVPKDAAGAATFLKAVIEATAPYAAAYKPNLAFFIALGAAGFELLLQLRDWIPAGALLVGDAKWGDIGNTAEKYATAAFDILGLDAVTVNPYLGSDSVGPFLERRDRGAFVLCRSSNPDAGEFQDLGGTAPLYLRVAQAAERWNTKGNCGLVAGANDAAALGQIRELAPSASYLVPGVGAQAGDLDACVHALVADGPAVFLINASRSILYAGAGDNYWQSAAAEARRLRDAIAMAIVNSQ